MSNDILTSLLSDYEQKKRKAEVEFEHQKTELYKKIPRLHEIEDELNSVAINETKNILLVLSLIIHFVLWTKVVYGDTPSTIVESLSAIVLAVFIGFLTTTTLSTVWPCSAQSLQAVSAFALELTCLPERQ